MVLPHLQREEIEALPLISATLTHRQWHDWDQTYNIRSKPLPMLAEEGNWVVDDLDDERRRIVLLIPLVPRLIVFLGLGPRDRRRAAVRWGTPSVTAVRA